jgi:hypothetical protein
MQHIMLLQHIMGEARHVALYVQVCTDDPLQSSSCLCSNFRLTMGALATWGLLCLCSRCPACHSSRKLQEYIACGVQITLPHAAAAHRNYNEATPTPTHVHVTNSTTTVTNSYTAAQHHN